MLTGIDTFKHFQVNKLREAIGLDQGFLTDEDYLKMMRHVLQSQERRILLGRYRSKPRTFRELGAIYQRSPERMRQKMAKGLRRLRVVVGMVNLIGQAP